MTLTEYDDWTANGVQLHATQAALGLERALRKATRKGRFQATLDGQALDAAFSADSMAGDPKWSTLHIGAREVTTAMVGGERLTSPRHVAVVDISSAGYRVTCPPWRTYLAADATPEQVAAWLIGHLAT